MSNPIDSTMMPLKPDLLAITWEWILPGTPKVLWPYLSDTDRFNQDAGLSQVLRLATPHKRASRGSQADPLKAVGGQWLETWAGPFRVRWREEPFSWVKGESFGIIRHYLGGPLRTMKVQVELKTASISTSQGEATHLVYRIEIHPRFAFLKQGITFLLQNVIRHRFGKAFKLASQRALMQIPAQQTWALGGKERLRTRVFQWTEAGGDLASITAIQNWVQQADDESILRLRPYEMASAWAHDGSTTEARRKALVTCLQATKAGILEMRWEPICPYCRGGKGVAKTLHDLRSSVHCDACNIDFSTQLDRSVEVTFRAHRAMRNAERGVFCVGSPARTLHIVLQQGLEPGAEWEKELSLSPGRYRLRCANLPGGLYVRVDAFALAGVKEEFVLTPEGWSRDERILSPTPRLCLRNDTTNRAQFLLERMEPMDHAAMAADVLCLQSFQDLFGAETLRPGEEIAVGQLAFLFTDLKGSTRLYREVGDAKAFGVVMDHFAILQRCIAENGGTVVKTIGDAVLAVFTHPEAALQAAVKGHQDLKAAGHGLILKTGIHCGSCIAVTQNDRLDYFGSTLNMAARLLNHCEGGDIVISRPALEDAGVKTWISQPNQKVVFTDFEELAVTLRGFEGETHRLLRMPLNPGYTKLMQNKLA